MLRRVAVVGLAVSLWGCPGFGDAVPEGPPAPTWVGEVEPIVQRWCGDCHAEEPVSGAPMSLASYGAVLAQAGLVHRRTLVQRSMPPGVAMAPGDLALLDAWFAGGMPSGADADWLQLGPLFAEDCTHSGCHGPEAPAAGLDLTTYAGFSDRPDLPLLDALLGRNGVTQMPIGASWPAARIALVELWLLDGAPEVRP
jgi:hypothetical protein